MVMNYSSLRCVWPRRDKNPEAGRQQTSPTFSKYFIASSSALHQFPKLLYWQLAAAQW
jgi:hypothetical protein